MFRAFKFLFFSVPVSALAGYGLAAAYMHYPKLYEPLKVRNENGKVDDHFLKALGLAGGYRLEKRHRPSEGSK